ncbi:unnamed protein product [Cunninghamella blakesleeana]
MPPNNKTPSIELPSPPSLQVDVIINGSGPVGLFCACLLSQAKLSVRVFDIEFEPNHWGRGDWLHGRTLELLEKAGVQSELLKTGVQVEKINAFNNNKLIQSTPFVPEQVDSKYPFLLCCGQHITESSLQSHLSRLDVQVERPYTVTSIKECQDEYPLLATICNLQDNSIEEVKCKYIFGCDGAHGTIREQLNILFEGDTSEITGGVMDALIRTNFPGKNDVCLIQGDNCKTVSLFPRENGLTRIFVHFNENENQLRKEQHNRNNIQIEDIQREAKRALVPYRIEFLGTLYWSTYIVGQRLASTYDGMNQRVFLLGDAAHCQSPTLGQGVNTGFGDVFNLVWKLALVEQGVLKRDILKTYTYERRPVAKHVIHIDKIAAKTAASHESELYCQVVEQNRLFTSGFGIYYPYPNDNVNDNLLVWQGKNPAKNFKLLGHRAPNAKVFKASTGKKVRLFDGLSWLSFTVMLLVNDLFVHSFEETMKHIASLYNWYKLNRDSYNLNFIVVTAVMNDDIKSKWNSQLKEGSEIFDHFFIDKLNQQICHRGYEYENNSNNSPVMFIIRPDDYIGTICSGSDMVLSVQQYMENICIVKNC